MELVVLGRSAALANPGEACPSHLVRQGDVQLVLDCGPGCMSHLRQVVDDYRKVTAIFITHMHWDHFGDLPSFVYGLELMGLGTGYKPQLYLPPGGQNILNDILKNETQAHLAGFFNDVFDMHEFDPGLTYHFGPLQVSFVHVKHFGPTWGIQVTDGKKKRLAYSGDSGPADEMVSLAANADLFLCEAAWRPGEPEEVGHMTARQAGEIAAKAKAKKLLLVHLYKEHDWGRMLSEAYNAFGGPVEIAEELRSYFI